MKLILCASFLLLVTCSLGDPQNFQDPFAGRQSFGPVRSAAPRSIGGRQPVYEDDVQEIDFEPQSRQPAQNRNFLQSIHSVTTTTSTVRPFAKIVKQINQHNEDGSYTFGYESQDGSFRVETRGLDGITKGKYGYLDQNGELKEVEYTAGGQFGYEPSGKGIMVPPRAPPRKKTPFDDDEPDYDEEGNPIRPAGRGSAVAAQQLPQYQPPPPQAQHAPRQPTFQQQPLQQQHLQQQHLQQQPLQQQPIQQRQPLPARQSFQPQPAPRAFAPQPESFQPQPPQFSPPVPRPSFNRSPAIRSQAVPQQQFSYPEPEPQPIPVAPPVRHQKHRSPLNDFFAQHRQHRF